ncbi:MAG: 30S ribosomal protein S8 [Patescibacteria group bacterium]|jgi:small subunit ribosomal protein S8
MTDPIADMLTRIRNAQAVAKETVVLPYSKMKNNLANILVRQGYLLQAEKIDNIGKPCLKLKLKYINREPAIRSLQMVSKPGRRVYLKTKALPYVMNNLGMAVISTSKGLMTNKEARKQKIGGEIICEIY